MAQNPSPPGEWGEGAGSKAKKNLENSNRPPTLGCLNKISFFPPEKTFLCVSFCVAGGGGGSDGWGLAQAQMPPAPFRGASAMAWLKPH